LTLEYKRILPPTPNLISPYVSRSFTWKFLKKSLLYNKAIPHIKPFAMKVEYNNLYTHFVFTTSHRLPVIKEKHRERIEKYITGIIKNNQSQLYEHVHFVVSRSPALSEEKLATIVADNSEKFINDYNLCSGVFKWKDTCAAFSVSKAEINRICQYILNQPEHHKTMSFNEESERFLKYYQKTIKAQFKIR
jgi:REP element-mobilizing transposase RayT